MELFEILIGLSDEVTHYDIEHNDEVKSEFIYNSEIIKHNGAPINSQFFYCLKNNVVSAVIYSKASFHERYDRTNTFAFINPDAINKLGLSFFSDIICWTMNNEEYVPVLNGIVLDRAKTRSI